MSSGQVLTVSEPLSPHGYSGGIVPAFPSWQSAYHIGDTRGCYGLAIQHPLQTPYAVPPHFRGRKAEKEMSQTLLQLKFWI